MAACENCYKRVKAGIGNAFTRYGELVGRHPVPFIVLPILIFGGLGVGLLAMDEEKDLETIYFPTNSRALGDRQVVRDTFPDLSNQSYHAFSLSDVDNAVTLIFQSKAGQSIFDAAVTAEINTTVEGVKALSVSGRTFSDFCARASSACLVDGEFVLQDSFQTAVQAGSVTYPDWNNVDLSGFLAGVSLTGTTLTSATVLKLSFKLTEDVADWKTQFLDYAGNLALNHTEVSYETPDSLNLELDKSTQGDIVIFALTITLCCTYASVVSVGGNAVSTRCMLAFGGILAAGLGIVGSMGLLCLCGVKFVNIVGVIPFLIIGIGVDDMFLMMSSWSESLPTEPEEQTVGNVPRILGKTLSSAGIGISITSLTDVIAFLIGTASVFKSVINFSLYAGIAVLFCYLANVTLFSGCLAIHGRRVYSSRHTFTCLPTKSSDKLKTEDQRSACFALTCGGSPPSQPRDDQSLCEKLPGMILPYVVKSRVVSVLVVILFLGGYLSAAIYGTVHTRQGLDLQELVLDSSYYYKFLTVSQEYFPTRVPVGFIIKEQLDYQGNDGTAFFNLLAQARQDSAVDSSFERCWLRSYQSSADYTGVAGDFVTNLVTFLANNNEFQGDVVLDSSNTNILASRCFVYSLPSNDQYSNSGLMERMREVADSSSLPVFAYHSSFVAFEQYLEVMPATLLLVGCAVAVITVVTFLFLPHVLMVLLVVVTIVMILVGIFGFMYFWGLSLSSITMIHLVMSVGFSVDFSAHVCAAFLLSDSTTRLQRASDAVHHAAGPILNGATSTLLGVMLLLASSSFIFQSFFKVMVLVIVLGVLHAIFFLPAVLSLVGPENKERKVGHVADSASDEKAQDEGKVNGNGPSEGQRDFHIPRPKISPTPLEL